MLKVFNECNLIGLRNAHFFLLPSNDYSKVIYEAIRRMSHDIIRFIHGENLPIETRNHMILSGTYEDPIDPIYDPQPPQNQEEMPSDAHDPLPHDSAKRFMKIGTSRIPNAGLGAFCTVRVDSNVKIAVYKSWRTGLTYDQINDESYVTEYGFSDKKTGIALDAIDSRTNTVICLAGYINDSMEESKRNCKFVIHDGEVYVETTRVTVPGEEWDMDYGAEYWMDPNLNIELILKARDVHANRKTRRKWQDVIDAARAREQTVAAFASNTVTPQSSQARGEAQPTRQGIG